VMGPPNPGPRVAVIMPTHDRAPFLPRAIESLLAQRERRWELLIVDDASTDGTAAVVEPFLRDPRVRYRRLEDNVGLGAALNAGLDGTTAPFVAYLPSDDVIHCEHLADLVRVLERDERLVLAYAGVRHHYNRETLGTVDGWYQLVQVLHRRTHERWTERTELVTDDLAAMHWRRLRRHGGVRGTRRVTCEWVDHPGQLTKLVREPVGGINPFRQRYGIRYPLRFNTSVGDAIDEVAHYRRFRERPPTPPSSDGLKVLLVGELSYNPERILALEERGHRLYGLWTTQPSWYTAVGPVPFGHIQDLPADDWEAAIRRLRPDVIYGLLNWQAVPFAAEVRRRTRGIPFVWHFKEGPFICRERGTWPELLALTGASEGVIHSSREMADWFATFVPGAADPDRSLILDGDLPRADWFEGVRPARRLSDIDGEIHTVVPGRPIGLHPPDVAALAANGVHLHFYGSFVHGQWREWIETTRRLAPRHLHIHPTVGQDRWVREFSKYDAGWLHVFRSRNGGDLGRADWDDLNLPARMATLAAAGLPMIQGDNTGSIVAIQTVGRELGVGLFHRDADELAATLRDPAAMATLRANVERHRGDFTFDTHADDLIAFFRRVIAADASPARPARAAEAR
jgi:glycosyltransferase involved in cell wall biosynthesis